MLPTAVPSRAKETTGRPDASAVAWQSSRFFEPPPTMRMRLNVRPDSFAKVWMTYLLRPYDVSLGAQKNFMKFSEWLTENRQEDLPSFFRRVVAMVMLWKSAERVVSRRSFQGYRHNIVTYTLAWLLHGTDRRLEFEGFWQRQAVDETVLEAVDAICGVVNDHIRVACREAIVFVYGALDATPLELGLGGMLRKQIRLQGYTLGPLLGDPARRARALREITSLLARGDFTPVVDSYFPLDRIQDAHRHLESNRQIGKIVVTP